VNHQPARQQGHDHSSARALLKCPTIHNHRVLLRCGDGIAVHYTPVVSSTCNPGVRIGTCLKRMSQHSHNDHYNMCCHLWRRLCCVRLCNCRQGEHNFDRPLQFTSIRLLMQRSVFQPCTIVIRPNRLSFPQSICLSFIKAVL